MAIATAGEKFEARAAESFDFKEILYTKRDWVATVTINRPGAYNCYSTQTLKEMILAFQDASWDDGVAVVVLTGAGDRAFCTGGDVKEYADEYTKKPREYWKWMGLFVQCHDLLRNIGKPTVARLNGMVVGGGNEFNMACDLAVMAEHAYIRQVGTRVGSVACGGATQWLPIFVGDRRARQILMLCEEIDAYTALDWGLANEVVPSVKGPDGHFLSLRTFQDAQRALRDKANKVDFSLLDEAVSRLSQKLVDKFPECTRYTKQQTNFWKDLAWHTTIGHARDWLALHYTSREPAEGMHAFVEKREPDYRQLREIAAGGGSSEFLWGPNTVTCRQCGTKWLPSEFEFCGKCGKPL
ncbi:MAG: enoyl-CoA hydratase/isomerase family protein [Armatimonadetes bacterium]|nr:enoyl-CoA hydratase/isomerase family protein [Armatimonadota bacterium]